MTESSSTSGSYTETQEESVPIAVATSQSDVSTAFEAQQEILVNPIVTRSKAKQLSACECIDAKQSTKSVKSTRNSSSTLQS